MLTRREFLSPETPRLTGNPAADVAILAKAIADRDKALSEYLRSLNQPGMLFEALNWTPTVSSGSGTITTASAAGTGMKIGDRYFVFAKITVTTNGTGATSLKFTLPVTTKEIGCFYGLNTNTGKAITGDVASASSTAGFVFYDGTYPGADGRVFEVFGSFI